MIHLRGYEETRSSLSCLCCCWKTHAHCLGHRETWSETCDLNKDTQVNFMSLWYTCTCMCICTQLHTCARQANNKWALILSIRQAVGNVSCKNVKGDNINIREGLTQVLPPLQTTGPPPSFLTTFFSEMNYTHPWKNYTHFHALSQIISQY